MSLRRYLTIFVAALLLASMPAAPLCAQNQKAPDQLRILSREELDVLKVLTAQERDWNHGDLDAFASGYKKSPDILFVGHQTSRGYDQMLGDYKFNYPNRDAMGVLSYADLEPHILDDHFAVVLGRYHIDRNKKAGGPADAIFSLVMEKTAAGWKIIVSHTT